MSLLETYKYVELRDDLLEQVEDEKPAFIFSKISSLGLEPTYRSSS